MLIHISPVISLPYSSRHVHNCMLKEVSFPELYISFTDLMVGRPYPNKRYYIGCFKNRYRKAYNGFIFEYKPFSLSTLSVQTVWNVSLKYDDLIYHHEVTHLIHYNIIDNDFDLISNLRTLHEAQYGTEFHNRSTQETISKMLLSCTIDNYYNNIFVENYNIPTIEPERLNTRHAQYERIPPLPKIYNKVKR